MTDFEALKEKSRQQLRKAVDDATAEWWDSKPGEVKINDPFKDCCYCDCASGGPCEHEFDGWRDFEDGHGGEQFCQRCGMGAMGHSMRMGI